MAEDRVDCLFSQNYRQAVLSPSSKDALHIINLLIEDETIEKKNSAKGLVLSGRRYFSIGGKMNHKIFDIGIIQACRGFTFNEAIQGSHTK